MIYFPAMLKTFDECQKKYFYKYESQINLPQNKYLFEKGKKIHALASYFIKGFNVEKLEKDLTSSELELWNYLKSLKYFSMDFVESEYQLSYKVSENWISGRLDAIVKQNEDYYILDYKTGSIPQNSQYDYQTMTYLLSADKLIKNYNSLNFVYLDLKNKQEEKITFTKNLEKIYIEKINCKIAEIENCRKTKFGELDKNKCNCYYLTFCR